MDKLPNLDLSMFKKEYLEISKERGKHIAATLLLGQVNRITKDEFKINLAQAKAVVENWLKDPQTIIAELTQQNEGLRKDLEGMSKENERLRHDVRLGNDFHTWANQELCRLLDERDKLKEENERLKQRIDEHIENSTK